MSRRRTLAIALASISVAACSVGPCRGIPDGAEGTVRGAEDSPLPRVVEARESSPPPSPPGAKPEEGVFYRATGFPAGAYHQQDGISTCGAAAIQMMLGSLGTVEGDQANVYARGLALSTLEDWSPGIAPDGLAASLDEFHQSLEPAAGTPTALWLSTSANRLAHRIAWSLFRYHQPVVVLIGGDVHWVVVCGFEGGGPTAGDAASPFPVAGFLVADPFPPIGCSAIDPPPPPPHANADACGSWGMQGQAERYVPLDVWLASYSPAIPTGTWHGKIAAVGDAGANPHWLSHVEAHPAAAPAAAPAPVAASTRPSPAPAATPTPVAADVGAQDGKPAKDAKDPKGALALAEPVALRAYLAKVGLDQLDVWARSLAGARLDTPALRVLPLFPCDERAGFALTALPRSSPDLAVLGRLEGGLRVLDAQRAEGVAPRYLVNLTAKTAAELAILDATGKPATVAAALGDGWTLEPDGRWSPTAESQSPYHPFRVLRRRDETLYVRLDGAVFGDLSGSRRGE